MRRPGVAAVAPAAAVLAAAGAAGWWLLWPGGVTGTSGGPPAAADVARGEALYAENCAVCHGGRLEGQPDWQSPGADGRLPAPPHDETGHTWHHGDRLLFDYTRLGGREAMARRGVDFDSGMPGFGEVLSDREIGEVLAFIKSRWPDPMRAFQSERTAAETAGNGG